MWIVKLALQRPYTFIVMAIMILLATPLAIMKTPTDVLPSIEIPVISVIWSYGGMPAKDMSERFTAPSERTLTSNVNDIEHMESQTLAGIAVIKIFLQPDANLQSAIAETVSAAQSIVKQMPQGTTPPVIISYSASSIPVLQLGLSSPTISEQKLADLATNFLRPQLITVPGARLPLPYGGRTRVISVDLDLRALQAKGLTPADIVNAVNTQNLILPTGTAKIGQTEFTVETNASPDTLAALNRLPVRTRNDATIYLGEVAHVRDGFSPQTNIVRNNGHHGVLMTILKKGDASTLQVVDNIRKLLPSVQATLPADLNIAQLFDQSIFVKAAIQGVIREALVAACLTAAMILLFLGNWRSTAIIAVSIPLSVFTSLLALSALHETINIMTLGGLALAVGILVDDATVTIENIERHLHMGTGLYDAILDGAGEIAVPALVSTLCICIVFVPMFFLTGVARYLFVPMAEAVVFAMIASYVISRTLVPTLALMLFKGHTAALDHEGNSLFVRVYRHFNAGFERVRAWYIVLLGVLLERRRLAGGLFLGFCLLSLALVPLLGEDFFPSVDSGDIRLHMRAPTGFRIEETARLADEVERVIRTTIPPDQLGAIVDNLGLPVSGVDLSYSNAGTIGSLDGEILISLKPGQDCAHQYIDQLREILPQRFPGSQFFFQPSDIVTQILNFGQPAAIDVQVQGADLDRDARIAARLMKQVRAIPGTVDVHVLQRNNEPTLMAVMDRTRLQQLGLSAQNVAQDMLISLSGSSQTTPTFWVNPRNGVQYPLTIETPQYQIGSVDDLLNTPVSNNQPSQPYQLLDNLVTLKQQVEPAIVSHYNTRPEVDVYASVQGRDLGSVASRIDSIIAKAKPGLPRGTKVTLRGQIDTMRSSYLGLGAGVAMALVLVYLLIVVNFQSWVDPLIIISAMPAGLAGIAWMLFATGTHLSVPALTGAIMTVGVATANSILVVAFARQRMAAGVEPLAAALEAGATRIRPVLMTALAMIIGMVPMALGLGEGAEQNAPLGRAVIGGLLFATVSTLLFVPLVFGGLHGRLARRRARLEAGQTPAKPESAT
jgi:multidrug efflux pump subunit AcrB